MQWDVWFRRDHVSRGWVAWLKKTKYMERVAICHFSLTKNRMIRRWLPIFRYALACVQTWSFISVRARALEKSKDILIILLSRSLCRDQGYVSSAWGLIVAAVRMTEYVSTLGFCIRFAREDDYRFKRRKGSSRIAHTILSCRVFFVPDCKKKNHFNGFPVLLKRQWVINEASI
jgi:hypothetical protein